MKRYEKYKKSGVEWICDIPEGWGISKLGFYTTKIGAGSTPKGGSEIYPDSGIPFIRSQNVHFNGLKLDDTTFIDLNTHDCMKGSKVFKSDNLLNITGGSIGRCCIVEVEGEMNVNQHVSIIRTSKNLINYYLNYILGSDIGQSQVKYNITGGNREGLTIEGIRNFKIVLPPLKEQEQIIFYLNEKTSHIDKLLDISKRKIGLLKEQRASIINQVVTKGLNPNAKMKNSGVEWIGYVPEGWGVNKVGNNTYVKGRIGWKGLKSEDFLDEGPYLVTGTDFNKDGTINWANIYHVSNERYDEDPFIQLKDNDVLITKDGTIGKVVYVGNLLGKTCLNSGIFLTRPTNGQYISRYFFWVLNSNVFKVFVYFNSNGATIQHLYQNVFINFKFPIPPLIEQENIIAYLDEKTSIIDKSISIEERRIGLLKEYRQSIISQVVTGKIKVIADE